MSVTALSSASAVAAVGEVLPAEIFDGRHTHVQPPSLPASQAELQDMSYPGLSTFVSGLLNGTASDVVGMYVRDILALPVEQQPTGQPAYVAPEHNMLTQFDMPKQFGSVGILAHNYLSGSRFPQLTENTEIILVYGNGRVDRYRVSRIERFQALKPNSPFSEFIDLNDPAHQVMSSAELFKRMYTTPHQLVLQTCIEAEGESSWGRLFVVATPDESLQFNIPALDPLLNMN